jgi:hypothetical protein
MWSINAIHLSSYTGKMYSEWYVKTKVLLFWILFCFLAWRCDGQNVKNWVFNIWMIFRLFELLDCGDNADGQWRNGFAFFLKKSFFSRTWLSTYCMWPWTIFMFTWSSLYQCNTTMWWDCRHVDLLGMIQRFNEWI